MNSVHEPGSRTMSKNRLRNSTESNRAKNRLSAQPWPARARPACACCRAPAAPARACTPALPATCRAHPRVPACCALPSCLALLSQYNFVLRYNFVSCSPSSHNTVHLYCNTNNPLLYNTTPPSLQYKLVYCNTIFFFPALLKPPYCNTILPSYCNTPGTTVHPGCNTINVLQYNCAVAQSIIFFLLHFFFSFFIINIYIYIYIYIFFFHYFQQLEKS